MTFEEQVKANKIIDGKPISEHPKYPFNEVKPEPEELAEITVRMCIKRNRTWLTIKNLAKALNETLAPEEIQSLMAELKNYGK